MNLLVCTGLPLAVAVLAAGSPAAAQAPKRVNAVGQAAGTGPRAQDEALQAAQRQAVEMACGLFIDAQSQTEDFALVKDRILGQAAGFINEYRELRRWVEGDVSFVEIEAVVSVADFEREWQTFLHAKEEEGNPRIMVIVFEDNDVDDVNPPVANGICQSGLESFFLSKDVQLVDRDVLEDVRQRDLTLADLDNDIAGLAAAAAEFKTEVLVLGRAEARRGGAVDVGGRTVYRWDITLTVRAVQADSGAILMSQAYRPAQPVQSVSAAVGDDAFINLIHDVAADVLRDIGRAWHKRAAARRILQVKVSDLPSRQAAKALCEALADHRGVVGGREGATLKNFTHGVANVEVDWKFDLDLLADTIEGLELEGLVFEVVEQTSNRISVKAIPQGEPADAE